ncbi:unnamed protein product [Cylicostephanus goldi]|uniref:Uncharacterized protein n=1 Tax=Cylicostephanus goldi TaxID=71465 RepID=A0A3P7N884_CYLGO|nr:unnamed protein product [Cylicostephanus goldi]
MSPLAAEATSVLIKDNDKEASISGEEGAGHCQKHCPLTVHRVRRNSDPREPQCKVANDKTFVERYRRDDYMLLVVIAMFFLLVFTTLVFAEPERCETNCEKINEDPPILMKSSPHAHSHGVRSITFVLALSIHSVIEGIALGVGVSFLRLGAGHPLLCLNLGIVSCQCEICLSLFTRIDTIFLPFDLTS